MVKSMVKYGEYMINSSLPSWKSLSSCSKADALTKNVVSSTKNCCLDKTYCLCVYIYVYNVEVSVHSTFDYPPIYI